MKRRVIGSFVALVVVAVFHTAAFPLCALYTPSDPEYYVFFCYLKDADTSGR